MKTATEYREFLETCLTVEAQKSHPSGDEWGTGYECCISNIRKLLRYSAYLTEQIDAINKNAQMERKRKNQMDGMSYVKYIKKGEKEIDYCRFCNLEEGDTFFSGGYEYVVGVEAHKSGDASYDGYLLYDTEDEGWFPEDLDVD